MTVKQNPSLFVVSGASGSGKTTICRTLADEFGLYYSVSHTTRPKQENEIEGRDYYFITRDAFQSMIDNDDFIEWAPVYHNFYGTSKKVVEEHLQKNQGVILDLDTQGAASIKKHFPDAILIFLKTSTLEDLKKRLQKRGRDSEEEIKKRVAYAKNEMAKMNQYDFIILNDNLENAVALAREIVKKYL